MHKSALILIVVAVFLLAVMSMNVANVRSNEPRSVPHEVELALSGTAIAISSLVVFYKTGLDTMLMSAVNYRSSDGAFLLSALLIAALSYGVYDANGTYTATPSTQSKRSMQVNIALLVLAVGIALYALKRSLCARGAMPLAYCM